MTPPLLLAFDFTVLLQTELVLRSAHGFTGLTFDQRLIKAAAAARAPTVRAP